MGCSHASFWPVDFQLGLLVPAILTHGSRASDLKPGPLPFSKVFLVNFPTSPDRGAHACPLTHSTRTHEGRRSVRLERSRVKPRADRRGTLTAPSGHPGSAPRPSAAAGGERGRSAERALRPDPTAEPRAAPAGAAASTAAAAARSAPAPLLSAALTPPSSSLPHRILY